MSRGLTPARPAMGPSPLGRMDDTRVDARTTSSGHCHADIAAPCARAIVAASPASTIPIAIASSPSRLRSPNNKTDLAVLALATGDWLCTTQDSGRPKTLHDPRLWTRGLTMSDDDTEDELRRSKKIEIERPSDSRDKERDKENARRRERYATDPDYRAKVLARNRRKARERWLKGEYGLSL